VRFCEGFTGLSPGIKSIGSGFGHGLRALGPEPRAPGPWAECHVGLGLRPGSGDQGPGVPDPVPTTGANRLARPYHGSMEPLGSSVRCEGLGRGASPRTFLSEPHLNIDGFYENHIPGLRLQGFVVTHGLGPRGPGPWVWWPYCTRCLGHHKPVSSPETYLRVFRT